MKSLYKKTIAGVTAVSTFLASVTTAMALDVAPGENTGFFTSFQNLYDNLLKIVMAVGALLVFAYLIWGGIDWITSGGDKTKTEGARNKITAAVIGLIVLAASYAILQLVINLLGTEEATIFSGIQ